MKNVRLKDYTEAYNAGFAWVLILLGLMLLAVGNILPGMSPSSSDRQVAGYFKTPLGS